MSALDELSREEMMEQLNELRGLKANVNGEAGKVAKHLKVLEEQGWNKQAAQFLLKVTGMPEEKRDDFLRTIKKGFDSGLIAWPKNMFESDPAVASDQVDKSKDVNINSKVH